MAAGAAAAAGVLGVSGREWRSISATPETTPPLASSWKTPLPGVADVAREDWKADLW
jgi:hypothetical protein